MPHWKMKALIQGCVSLLPNPLFWNSLLQRYASSALPMTEKTFDEKLLKCQKHFDNFTRNTLSGKTGFTALEIGTGWYPVIPIGLFLCGGEKIWTIDKNDHLSFDRVSETLDWFARYANNGKLLQYLPIADHERIEHLLAVTNARAADNAEQLMDYFNMVAIVGDARKTGLETSTIDFVTSNTTLEYIPREILVEIFSEFKRIMTDGGIMSHYVPLADHYHDQDASITVFNYLQYSESVWRIFNNRLQYQSRLRIPDYRDIHNETGFEIVAEFNREGVEAELDSIKLAPEFQRYARGDLLVIESWIISRS